MIRLEKGINEVEHVLSMCAARTVIIPIFGWVKGELGAIQLTIAIASTIFTASYGLVTGNWNAYEKSVEHIQHGIANIVTGFFESIPAIQTLMNLTYLAPGVKYTNEQKFMPYKSLQKKNWLMV